jgi:ABC-type dipeptide/oligopeptide/nickel transport system ATPase subunit
MTREFKAQPGVRSRVPLLVGLMGPSGGGKTFSALRLAAGIQRIVGGKIYVIDTEARRALHYADQFQFEHLDFAPPFGSLDYLAAIRYCVGDGAKVVVIDSASHEHEGSGGYLEFHERELDRLSRGNEEKREKVNFLAWSQPADHRRKMVAGLLQLNSNFIFTFRAKEKLKLVQGKMVEQGWMPIAGDSLLFEMTVNCLLLPKADGFPTWTSDLMGERQMMKLPVQFKQLFANTTQLTEGVGEALATWAAAGSIGPVAPNLAISRHIAPNHATDLDSGELQHEEAQPEPSHPKAPPEDPPIPSGHEEMDKMLRGAAGVSMAALKAAWGRLSMPERAALKSRLDRIHKPRAEAIEHKLSMLEA